MITLQDVQRGYDAWAAKPHNSKWVRRIDGTPIPNDIVVTIFNTLCDLENTPAPEQHVRSSLLGQWREGAFETTADEAAQTALDDQAVGLDVAPIIEAWLTALATTEGHPDA